MLRVAGRRAPVRPRVVGGVQRPRERALGAAEAAAGAERAAEAEAEERADARGAARERERAGAAARAVARGEHMHVVRRVHLAVALVHPHVRGLGRLALRALRVVVARDALDRLAPRAALGPRARGLVHRGRPAAPAARDGAAAAPSRRCVQRRRVGVGEHGVDVDRRAARARLVEARVGELVARVLPAAAQLRPVSSFTARRHCASRSRSRTTRSASRCSRKCAGCARRTRDTAWSG